MKIALASDLHFEFHKNQADWLPPIAEGCDVIILAGDIGVGDATLDAVSKIASTHPDAQLVWLAGNHEFYRCSVDSQIKKFRDACVPLERVHYLENSKVEVGGITFLGCTLWSGFDGLGKENTFDSMQRALANIADFSLIAGGTFTPRDAAQKFLESRYWLERELARLDAATTVVVTHFPPCREARNIHFEESPLSAYFQANCGDLIERYQPMLWCYGHNHYSDELYIGVTRVVSNQLGYPGEYALTNYDACKIIEL